MLLSTNVTAFDKANNFERSFSKFLFTYSTYAFFLRQDRFIQLLLGLGCYLVKSFFLNHAEGVVAGSENSNSIGGSATLQLIQ